MAFVDIVRGQHYARVSQNMFDSYYKKMGYRKVRESRKTEKTEKYTDPFADAEERKESVDIDTIPISEMTGEQLKEYAAKHEIDISGTRSAKDARRVIQKHIQESKM